MGYGVDFDRNFLADGIIPLQKLSKTTTIMGLLDMFAIHGAIPLQQHTKKKKKTIFSIFIDFQMSIKKFCSKNPPTYLLKISDYGPSIFWK